MLKQGEAMYLKEFEIDFKIFEIGEARSIPRRKPQRAASALQHESGMSGVNALKGRGRRPSERVQERA